MIKKLSFLLLSLALISSCKSGGKKITGDMEVPDSVVNKGILQVSEQAMQDIIDNIASPVEMSSLIKTIGVPFSKQYLAPTNNLSSFNTDLQQSIVLGIYGADLGYLNMYNKTGTVIDYLSNIKTLSDNLKIGQFFDFNTLKRLVSNNSNIDSIMYISVHSFNDMDKYLRKNNRGNLSSLIITGVWVEGLYILTQVQKNNPNPKLSEKIGEQKIILNDLMLILKNYIKDPDFKKIIDDIEIIKAEFANVKISYEMGDPEAVEKDGMLVIVQNEKSIVNIDDMTLTNIRNTTEKIRNKLLNNK